MYVAFIRQSLSDYFFYTFVGDILDIHRVGITNLVIRIMTNCNYDDPDYPKIGEYAINRIKTSAIGHGTTLRF